eukprot:649213-Pelagomonas_calceolata.AAC.2
MSSAVAVVGPVRCRSLSRSLCFCALLGSSALLSSGLQGFQSAALPKKMQGARANLHACNVNRCHLPAFLWLQGF